MRSKRRDRFQTARIVALGGGTGLSTLLRGLKEYVASRRSGTKPRPIADLAAVVTVTDDGGSSGRLRREYSVLPPGDIRNCMVALSNDERLLTQLFKYRFPGNGGLGGHSFGNLFLTALTGVTGDFSDAVRVSSEVLAVRGRIFPSTEQNVTLEAELGDGTFIAGETRISNSHKRIERVRLVPRRARPHPETLRAIRQADLILVGPGSLYTSIIPNLLIDGVVEAISRSRGTCVYIANLMTQPGETQHYSVADHVRAIYDHTRRKLFDYVVINRAHIARKLLQRYGQKHAEPVEPSYSELNRMGLRYLTADLLQREGLVRHDPARLSRLLVEQFVTNGSNSKKG